VAKKKPAKERRRHPRAKPPMVVVRIAGKTFAAQDLSVGGTQIKDYRGPLTPGALLTIDGIGPKKDALAIVGIRARVNRADPDAGRLALTFLDIDAEAYEILRVAMAERETGLGRPEEDQP